MVGIPKQMVYRKPHAPSRPVRRKDSHERAAVGYEYGLVCMEPGWVRARQLEAVRLAIVRRVRERARKGRKGTAKRKLQFPVACAHGITQKPTHLRMGKGKGKVDHWVAPVVRGTVRLCVGKLPRAVRFEALRVRQEKLPVKTRIFSRNRTRLGTHFLTSNDSNHRNNRKQKTRCG